jgi:hypothetical protein
VKIFSRPETAYPPRACNPGRACCWNVCPLVGERGSAWGEVVKACIRANRVKIGKNRESTQKRSGCLWSGRKRSKAGVLAVRFIYSRSVAAVGLKSGRVRSLTPHRAITERVRGVWCERGSSKRAAMAHKKKGTRGHSSCHTPARRGRRNLTYLSRQRMKFES